MCLGVSGRVWGMSGGCLDMFGGGLDVSRGCLDMSGGCLDVFVGCLDMIGGVISSNLTNFHQTERNFVKLQNFQLPPSINIKSDHETAKVGSLMATQFFSK